MLQPWLTHSLPSCALPSPSLRRLTAVKRPAHTAAAAASSLDVSHATRTSSGLDASSIRGKRRKAVVPERSFVA